MAINGGYVRSLRLVVCSGLLTIFGIGLKAQESTTPSLADFVGTYADTPGHPVEILNGDEFFAVQDEAKYPLYRRAWMHSRPCTDPSSRSNAMPAEP